MQITNMVHSWLQKKYQIRKEKCLHILLEVSQWYHFTLLFFRDMLYERLKDFFFSDSFKSIMNKLTSLGSLWIFYDVYQCHCWLETVIFTCSNSLVPQCSFLTPSILELLCLNMIIKPFKGLPQRSSGTLSSNVRSPSSIPGQGFYLTCCN